MAGRKPVWPPPIVRRGGKEYLRYKLSPGHYREVLLGEEGSAPARKVYLRLVAEIEAGGQLPPQPGLVTYCTEAVAAYLKSRQGVDEPSTYRRRRLALGFVTEFYGQSPLESFGPLAFKVCRAEMVKRGWARKYVNALANCLRTWLRWCAANELLPRERVAAFAEIDGLLRGQTEAPEREERQPADPEAVRATIERLPPIPADMVRLQLFSGMRPGEVCRLLPEMIDRAWKVLGGVPVWLVRFRTHKTLWRGHRRDVPLGPQAQALLLPYLERRGECDPVFSVAEMLAAEGKKPRRLKLGDRFTTDRYDKLVKAACVAAGVNSWTPHMLRHRVGTDVGNEYDFEDVQAVLGHNAPGATAIYLKRLERAAKVIAKRG